MSRQLLTDRLALRPVASDDVTALRSIRASPWVARWWGDGEDDPGWPSSGADVTGYTVWLESETVGFVQCYEVLDSAVRYAGIDLFLSQEVSGRGFGREVIDRVVRHLVLDKGHHRVVIDPAVDNERAISCYAACGFTPVGVMTRYERNHHGPGWHDALMMEYVTPP